MSCDIIPFPGGYKMWYGGLDVMFLKGNIGYATSTDGIVWVRDTINSPVLKAGAPDQWDDAQVATAQVLQIDKTYYMWYTGWRTITGPRAGGIATLNDTGKTWTRYAGNPVLLPSGFGWDGTWLEVGTVLQRGDTLDMWYDGDVSPVNSNRYSIGHATSPVTAVGVSEAKQEVPQQYLLTQNYPNPFNPSTTIRYGLPNRSHVTLTVFNTLGQQVGQLVNGEQDAGYYDVRFDATVLASGVYIYKLTAGGFVQTHKMLVVR